MKNINKILADDIRTNTFMNLGNLYKVKSYFWLLFPTKETATAAAVTAAADTAVTATAAATTAAVEHVAAYWSRHCNCEVTYFSPDSYVVFLEENGRYKKVLTSNGRIGWTWFKEEYNDCFEEVKSE